MNVFKSEDKIMDIIKIWTHLLYGKPIIFVHESKTTLTAIIEVYQALLFPFEAQGVISHNESRINPFILSTGVPVIYGR